MLVDLRANREIVVGVIADTHIPDRVNQLHPELLSTLRQRNVDYIFHAGDVSIPGALLELREIAPVYLVTGNRDILLRNKYTSMLTFQINGVKTILTHGHLNLYQYWLDKIENVLEGYRFKRYHDRLVKHFPDAGVYIFGHSHHAENRWEGGKLFFNPGSPSIAEYPAKQLSFGIISFHPEGRVQGAIVELTGALLRFGRWKTGSVV